MQELLDRRWVSDDLVDHAFDNIVSISLATKITLCLLYYGIISVRDGKDEVAPDNWPTACIYAACETRVASKAMKLTPNMPEKSYSWSWSQPLNEGTEKGAQEFINIVGLLGFIFGNLFALDTTGLSKRNLRTRITTLPRHRHPLPLASPDSQDCRPDIITLHRTAFVAASEQDSARREEYLDKESILSTISQAWPQLRETYPEVFPLPCMCLRLMIRILQLTFSAIS